MTPGLEDLARELRLTWRQRCFAEALARDPLGNQTAAARRAGAVQSCASARGAKWAALGKVRQYLTTVRSVLAPPLAQVPRRLAELGEVLELLTDQARGRLGSLLDAAGRIDLEKVRTAPAGLVRELEVSKGKRRVKLESPQGAAEKLLRFHLGAYSGDRDPAKPTSVTVNLALLLSDPALRRQLAGHARLVETVDAEPAEAEPSP